VACAAALAAIDVTLDEDLPARSRMLGNIISEELARISSPHLAGYQGRGCFWSLFVKDDSGFSAQKLAERLLSRGILTYASGSKIRIGPPLIIREQDLRTALAEIRQVLEGHSFEGSKLS
jgi:ornithine--oxo-acid transaminase